MFMSLIRIKYIIIFSLFFIHITSCKDESASEAQVCSFDLDIAKREEIKASKFYTEINYVPLETTNNSMISNSSSVFIGDNRIAIMDTGTNSQRVFYIFDKSGKFINKIARPTEGIEKILGVNDVIVDNDILEIVDRIQGKILYFDILSNKLKKTVDIPKGIEYFAKFSNGDYALSSGYRTIDSTGNALFVLNSENLDEVRVLDLKIPEYLENYGVQLSPFSPLSFNDCYLHYHFFSEAIYRISNQMVSLSYQINMGSLLPSEDYLASTKGNPQERFRLLNNPEYSSGFRLMNESQKSLLAVFPYRKRNYYLIYNKSTRKTNIYYFDRKIGNDIDYGIMPTLPRSMTKDNELVFIMNPYVLKDFLYDRKQNLSQERFNVIYNSNNAFFNIAETLMNTDNPVVIFAKINNTIY